MKDREVWPEDHAAHAFWFEKGVGLIVLLGGAWFTSTSVPPIQYFFIALTGFGLNVCLPSARPLFSTIVDRLPFFASKKNN